MTGNSFSQEPWHAMASWLKHLFKFSKTFSHSHGRLVNLHATQKIPHLLLTAMFEITSAHHQLNKIQDTKYEYENYIMQEI